MNKIVWKDIKWKNIGMDKLILVLAAGILLLVIVWPAPGPEKGTKENVQLAPAAGQQAAAGTDSYERELENRLKEILSKVEGVGAVDVMITLKSSGEMVIQTDSAKTDSVTEESDSAGGTRKINQKDESLTTVIVDNGTGGNAPYVRKEMTPEISGIIISAQGGGSSVVKNEIYQAVLALFDVPSHKIKVLKKE